MSGRTWLGVVAVVAVVVALSACAGEDDVPVPALSAPAAVASTVTTSTVFVGDWVLGAARPNAVAGGGWFELVPLGEVGTGCNIAAGWYTPVPFGNAEYLGMVLHSGAWVPNDPVASTTIAPCGDPPPGTAPVSVAVPAELDAGLYEVCLDGPLVAEGCALVRVVVPGEVIDGLADASTDPTTVAPGQAVVVTASTGDSPVCSRLELHVAVDGVLDLVGFPTAAGSLALPTPGATTTSPRCGPGDEAHVVMPDVPDGDYVICLASRFDTAGCARVTVARR